MAKGDTVVVYHSQTDKAAIGLAKVVRAGYPDPTDAAGKRVSVDAHPFARSHEASRSRR